MIISISQGREIAALFGTNEAVMLSKQHGASRSLFLRQKLIVSDAFRCRADGPPPPPGPHRTRSDSSDRRSDGAEAGEGGREGESNGNLVDSTASVGRTEDGEQADGGRPAASEVGRRPRARS